MSLGAKTLEATALEALIDGDEELAAELVDQLSVEEARRVGFAAKSLSLMAARVADEPLRRRHLRVVS